MPHIIFRCQDFYSTAHWNSVSLYQPQECSMPSSDQNSYFIEPCISECTGFIQLCKKFGHVKLSIGACCNWPPLPITSSVVCVQMSEFSSFEVTPKFLIHSSFFFSRSATTRGRVSSLRSKWLPWCLLTSRKWQRKHLGNPLQTASYQWVCATSPSR